MFGKNKKREQEAQEAAKRAEEAERLAREARAEADAMQEKRGLFGKLRKKRPAAEEVRSAPAAEPAPEPAAKAEASPVEPAPTAAPAAAPKESRRARKAREKEEKRAEERIRDLELRLSRSEQKRRSARFCDFFAFFVLLCAALLMLLEPVLKIILTRTGGDLQAMTTVSTVAQYCLLAAIAIPAWYFVYRKGIVLKIVYIVALVAFVVGNVLGLTL